MSEPQRHFPPFSLALIVALLLSGCSDDRSDSRTTEGVPAEITMSDDALVEELADGGEVVYIRHSATDTSEADEDMSNLEDCSTQRNLTREGRRQAEEIGAAFDRLELPIGEVLASPFCRTRQTAEFAFGREEVRTTRDLLSPEYVPPDEATEVGDYETKLRRLLSTPPEDGTDTVIIGHESVLRTVTGESVAEGGAVIFQPFGDRDYRVIGTIGPDEWRRLT